MPQAVHRDLRVHCDAHSWLQRGWCRTELWCYYLSTRTKTPIIEVKSADSVRFTALLWHRNPVHTGDFAVEADRASCSRVIQAAMKPYVAKLQQSNMTAYRLYLSLFEELTGLAPKLRRVDEFASEFLFSKPLQRYNGLGPVACAALAGDEPLVRSVAAAKASINTRAPAMPGTQNVADYTPLDPWGRNEP